MTRGSGRRQGRVARRGGGPIAARSSILDEGIRRPWAAQDDAVAVAGEAAGVPRRQRPEALFA